jgi:arylsulfatase A-like enzyme
MKQHIINYIGIGTLALSPILLNAQAKSQQPNIVFILADDIGFGDFGCYGATKIKTENIDAIAKKGVRFTNAYSPASTSSPTRYALLTGEYAWRKKVGILPADANLSIDLSYNTLPKILKSVGYQTGLVGKWHLGLGSKSNPVNFNKEIKYGPLEIGFDYAFYYPATNDRVPCIYIENKDVVNSTHDIEVSYRKKVGNDPTGKDSPELLKLKHFMGHDGTIVNGIGRIGWMSGGEKARWVDEDMAEDLLEKATDFIKTQREEEPFFLLYTTHNAHEPRVPSEKFKGVSEAGIYGDVIEEFDYCVGKIVKTLKERNLYENTILIITSDNGPRIKTAYEDGALENINEHDPYCRLRGRKGTLYEGGSRIPFLFSWPLKQKKYFVQNQPFCYIDMLASLNSMLNIEVPTDQLNDSKNASALFFDSKAKEYRDYIMIQDNGGNVALRKGDWKFIPSNKMNKNELYNLRLDPSEQNNCLLENEEIAEKMKSYYYSVRDNVNAVN